MLRIVARNHKDWVRLVQSMGGKEYSEDVVQEMYIKLNKYASPDKYIRNGKPNKGYIYFTLKSILYTYFKEKKKITKMPETCLNNIECIYEEVKISADQRLSEKIEAEIKTWHWYDQAIFNWYRNEGISFRKMSAITKISWVALFGTVKRCKKRLREAVGDDYLDYINKDYELIKMEYYQHKDKPEVTCSVTNNTARFGKWVWNGNKCTEVFTIKEVTKDFKKSFKEISQREFNLIWGNKLQKA